MDLYRYFHPHHNPRLNSTPLRLQELAELKQGALELSRAVKRAQIRCENKPIAHIHGEHFHEILAALDFAIDTLASLTSAHPGDAIGAMHALVAERKNAPGWEVWSRLLRQRLELLEYHDLNGADLNDVAKAVDKTQE